MSFAFSYSELRKEYIKIPKSIPISKYKLNFPSENLVPTDAVKPSILNLLVFSKIENFKPLSIL